MGTRDTTVGQLSPCPALPSAAYVPSMALICTSWVSSPVCKNKGRESLLTTSLLHTYETTHFNAAPPLSSGVLEDVRVGLTLSCSFHRHLSRNAQGAACGLLCPEI